jgi:hypothetical protein
MFQMMGFFAEFERGMMDVKKSKKSLRACGSRINAADRRSNKPHQSRRAAVDPSVQRRKKAR